MRILVLNSGSSSLRFALYEGSSNAPLASGLAECLNSPDTSLTLNISKSELTLPIPGSDHEQALRSAVTLLQEHGALTCAPDAIGHRIVHGGEYFSAPTIITPTVIERVASCNHLAPLHNPSGLLGVNVAQQIFPDTPQVAIFDTSFHQSLPERAYLYAIPRSYHQQHGVRRYGFHGTSHSYVAQTAAQQLNLPVETSRILSTHLGNGCSATAILNGQSVDTTMGMTPLEGLVMGTRSGDIDPGALLFFGKELNMPIQEISDLLNKQSGLLGLSNISNDMRELREQASDGSDEAALAIEIFCYRAAKSLASLTVALGGLDTLIFTGGIGENDPLTRQQILRHLSYLGLNIDSNRNSDHGSASNGIITTDTSTAQAAVIPTNEELMIARLTQNTLVAHR
ncbi:MAG: acetate kinase [Verrucomicrobiae bacterium]|nr:acetate kinase [Verrucomicrobiae bacterium]NNJ44134.1 acetate kinase [Akkermansiaceae bacterium]